MNEQKFHIPALVCSILGFVLAFFAFGVEAVAAGGIGLGLSLAKRRTHRTRLSLVLSILAILGGLAWVAAVISLGINGMGGTDYWLYTVLFGKME